MEGRSTSEANPQRIIDCCSDGLKQVWYLRVKHQRPLGYFEPPDITFEDAARQFASARYQALERVWLQEGSTGVSWIGSPVLRDQLQRGRGRLEVMVLPHAYLRLDPLVGVA